LRIPYPFRSIGQKVILIKIFFLAFRPQCINRCFIPSNNDEDLVAETFEINDFILFLFSEYTKHYTENERASNTNPTKNRE
jgi:hypothetical protein